MRHIASTMLTLLVVLGTVLVGAIFYGQSLFTAPGPTEGPVEISVPTGTTMAEVSRDLEAKGAITDARIFRIGARYLGKSEALKAADYRIAAGASMAEILEQITRGADTVQLSVTIPEGFSVFQVIEVLRASEILSGEITEIPAEGTLLPETYFVTRGTDRQAFLARMQDAMTIELAAAWEARDPDLPFETPAEALTLASIVEKETGIGGEREVVASVYINRLNRDMRLDSDPTVIYGILKGEPVPGFDLTTAHLESRQNLWNTRVFKGLPPSPIANPGKEAIRAVMQPATTEYFYFVADGSGGHQFARTLAEHNENVRRWMAIERQREQQGN